MYDPYIVHRLMAIFASGAALMVMAYHAWAIRFSHHDLMAAFRLRWLGAASIIVPMLLWLILMASVFTGTSHITFGHDQMLLGAIMPLLSGIAGFVLYRQFKTATVRAVNLAKKSSPYTKLTVSEHYAAAFPEDAETLLPLLDEQVTLRVAADLVAKGARVRGRPLDEVLADTLENKGENALVERALDLGVFRRKPKLEKRMRTLLKDADMLAWDAILSRNEDAPRVGSALTRMLEDAITFQSPVVTLEVKHRERLDRASTMAINAIVQALKDHLARLHLKLTIPGESYDPPTQGALENKPLPWTIVLEPLEVAREELSWDEYERVDNGNRVSEHVSGFHTDMEGLSTQIAMKRVVRISDYPMLKLRCSIRRDGNPISEVEADSSPGLSMAASSDGMKKGTRPTLIAAHMMLRSITQGAGLRIIGDDVPILAAWPGIADAINKDRSLKLPTAQPAQPEELDPQEELDTQVDLDELAQYAGEHRREELAEALAEVEASLVVKK